MDDPAYANAFTEGNRTAVAGVAGCLPIMYVPMDGVQVPVIAAEAEGRAGRIGCVFTQTTSDEEGRPIRDPDLVRPRVALLIGYEADRLNTGASVQ
jgi:hypothetical protein